MTAVEWLINEFKLYYNGESQLVYWQIIDKAKEMERDQLQKSTFYVTKEQCESEKFKQ
jgi:hypothetical protein